MSKARSLQLLTADQLAAPTPSTFAEYRETLKTLVDQLERVKRMTERYPVYLLLSGQRYKFDEPDEVDRFLAKLRKEVAAFELAKNGPRPQPSLASV